MIEFFTMDQIFRTLLIRYQNYLLEFYQLIEDKELIEDDQLETSQHVKKFLENMPELAGAFEIAFSITKEIGGMQTTWSVDISEEGFSVRSFTQNDEDDVESDEWYLHYHNADQEYEGNLFNDGDWDLFLEEVAELDDYDGGHLSASIYYRVD